MSGPWWSQAACHGAPSALFFPEKARTPGVVATIDRWCVPCPVRAECLAEQLDLPARHRWGVRGGVWWMSSSSRGTAWDTRAVVDPYRYLPAGDEAAGDADGAA